ncbi:sugar ABC transporter permease [Virgisporangium aurantiacum]|uniref:Sugar ABC transporter permease n=1 Tax=Virgisporangium aurantiacum TaxID=175570 RepID=A0A8J4E3R6_9ACTN|nr:sugar ABC transporter permease [Virgisporangium aurantiacum]
MTTVAITRGRRPWWAGRAARLAVLTIGAVVFLFPFYYMLVGSLQAEPRSDLGGAAPDPGNLTTANYSGINAAISLGTTLLNSVIFAGGVVLCTVVFGLLAGYALAVLDWRGRDSVFAIVLLVQIVPFQLLMIPLYILIVRSYGLSDSYLGMILPFAISPVAVFVFRQFFRTVPRELFDAARIDGASELSVLRFVATPLVRPALLTVVLLTFIGPWNEFLWPFLITKQQDMQPLAVALANYMSNLAGREANPYGGILAGACVLAAPPVVLFALFQSRFTAAELGSGVKG